MDQKQYMPACNSAFYDKGCCTRINEMMPREPYGGMKAFKLLLYVVVSYAVRVDMVGTNHKKVLTQ